MLLRDVHKLFGPVAALRGVTAEIRPRATTVLLGPSGSGKSTALKLLAGLIFADRGGVEINGRALTPANALEHRRRLGYVIQEGGLFPHLTARGNVILLARYLKRPRREIDRRIAELADLVDLDASQLERYPLALSGGQRQRVALMRALMLDPDVLLLDEPLGALDPLIRHDLQAELRAIFRRLDKTVVLVTHDLAEAAYLGDDIVLLRDGRIVQRGPIGDLLNAPADPFVCRFVNAQRQPLGEAAR
ncbi:MAG TPA: ATP-binding cassette domain-containing protein [Gammaproteobacteria bacterium]|nr:ATP-binding cassette domain-containing protein [Gammaproteobacteria bacterium]